MLFRSFAVISGMILPKDHFANVTVTNGKVLTDGNRNIVIGLAFPGLSDSLKIEKEKSNEDIAIPETITICADVTEFTLEMSATIVTNNILSAIGLDNLASENKIDVVQGDVNKVGEVTNSLVSGTSDLKEGISTLNDKMGDFRIGANTLNEGIQAYTDGTNQLAEGINKLGGGVGTLSNGVVTLNSGIKEAKVGADSIVNGIMAAQDGNPSPLQISESLVSGSESLAIGISEMKTKIEGIQTAFQEISNAIQGMSLEYNILINKSSEEMTAEELAFLDSYNNLIQVLGIIQGSDMSGIDQLLAGCQQLQMGTNGMNIAINTILNGSKSLQTGLEKLTNGGNELQTGVSTLSCGIQEIQNGANNLIGKNNDLQKGASQISVASTQLANGTNQLKEGATLLDDGMIQFDKEAISKLIDAFDGDLNSFFNVFKKYMNWKKVTILDRKSVV